LYEFVILDKGNQLYFKWLANGWQEIKKPSEYQRVVFYFVDPQGQEPIIFNFTQNSSNPL